MKTPGGKKRRPARKRVHEKKFGEAEKGKDGDAEESEGRDAKEENEGSERETETMEEIGARRQGTPNWNSHPED
ncbi:hypothetical protein NDU88_007005 [Pleurodeles waltl]|uniref:Uncharacterized protein n=1 Tax=Pleurodeles waltl TaxID=8319 RepID=A0AAV7N451_PLEWA|nr:hypothetical protein NDU88_007005 [Pleurodeles waltl]